MPCGSGIRCSAKIRIVRAGHAISKRLRDWPCELPRAIDLIHILDIHAVQKVQRFRAQIQLKPLIEVQSLLKTNIRVAVRCSAIGIAPDVPDAIIEREAVAIYIGPGKNAVVPRALQSADHR